MKNIIVYVFKGFVLYWKYFVHTFYQSKSTSGASAALELIGGCSLLTMLFKYLFGVTVTHNIPVILTIMFIALTIVIINRCWIDEVLLDKYKKVFYDKQNQDVA